MGDITDSGMIETINKLLYKSNGVS